MRSKTGFFTFAALIAILFCGQTAIRADDDLLKQQKQINKVRAQKLEADYRLALSKAYRVGRTDPETAIEILRSFLSEIKDDTALTDARRKRMVEALDYRIADYRQRVRKGTTKSRIEREAARKDREREQEDTQAAQKRALALKQQYDRLVRAGDYVGAAKLLKEIESLRGVKGIARIAQTDNRIEQARKIINENRELDRERARRFELAMRSVRRSAMPPIGDIEFPNAEKWKRLTKLRSPANRLDPKTKAILKALNTPVPGTFKDESFENIINYIGEKYKIPVNVSEAGMMDVGVEYNTSVTVRAGGVTLRTFLRKVLGELGMAYYIKNGAVNITSLERARELMTIRVYRVADLVGATNLRFGPAFNAAQMYQNVTNLITTIVTTVERESWAVNGGKGTITFDPRSLSLIVKQTAEVHTRLGGGRPILP